MENLYTFDGIEKRPMTEAEKSDYRVWSKQLSTEVEAEKKRQADRAAARLLLLQRLGISEEEAALLK